MLDARSIQLALTGEHLGDDALSAQIGGNLALLQAVPVEQKAKRFGAEIAGTNYYLNKLLTNPDGSKRARVDLQNHLQSLQAAASLLGSLDSSPKE